METVESGGKTLLPNVKDARTHNTSKAAQRRPGPSHITPHNGYERDLKKDRVDTSLGVNPKHEKNTYSNDVEKLHIEKKQLKSSETCPDQLTPKLPFEEQRKLHAQSRKNN